MLNDALRAACLIAGLAMPCAVRAQEASAAPGPSAGAQSAGEIQTVRGRAVWMAEALERRFEIKSDDDVAQSLIALETAGGELIPIVKDFRGRAFHADPRLRKMDLELIVRRRAGSPMAQVMAVYSIKADGKYEVDYWCEVCAIPMYEPKLCECCQEPNELRERRVAPATQ
jgi:hypothetical protein